MVFDELFFQYSHHYLEIKTNSSFAISGYNIIMNITIILFCTQTVDDESVQYGLIRYDMDEGRDPDEGGFRPVKFVFITWIGPDVTVIVRARANAQQKTVAK